MISLFQFKRKIIQTVQLLLLKMNFNECSVPFVIKYFHCFFGGFSFKQ